MMNLDTIEQSSNNMDALDYFSLRVTEAEETDGDDSASAKVAESATCKVKGTKTILVNGQTVTVNVYESLAEATQREAREFSTGM